MHHPFVIEQQFREDELVMICQNSHSLADKIDIEVNQIQKENFIMREIGSAGRDVFDSMMTLHGIKIDPIWESTRTQAIGRAVRANLGISILPYLLVKDSLDRKEIKRFTLKNITLNRKFRIIYHKSKYITQSEKEFIELCK